MGWLRILWEGSAELQGYGIAPRVFLIVPMLMFTRGIISATVLVWSQVINGGLLLVVMWLAERWLGPVRALSN